MVHLVHPGAHGSTSEGVRSNGGTAKEGCSGTTDKLLIDRTVTLDCHRHMLNLSVAWVEMYASYTSYRVVSLRAFWVTFDAPGWLDRDPYGIHTLSLSIIIIRRRRR